MEQRAAGREPVDLDAVVVCPRFGLLRAVIVDLGPGGMRIRAETNIVPIGAEVTVSFQAGRSDESGGLTLRGAVVHQSDHGFGIRFSGLDEAARRTLAQMLGTGEAAVAGRSPRLRAAANARAGLVDARGGVIIAAG